MLTICILYLHPVVIRQNSQKHIVRRPNSLVTKIDFTHFPLTMEKITWSYAYMLTGALLLICTFGTETSWRKILQGWKLFSSVTYSYILSLQNRSVVAFFKPTIQNLEYQLNSVALSMTVVYNGERSLLENPKYTNVPVKPLTPKSKKR